MYAEPERRMVHVCLPFHSLPAAPKQSPSGRVLELNCQLGKGGDVGPGSSGLDQQS